MEYVNQNMHEFYVISTRYMHDISLIPNSVLSLSDD
jgi:hypothetical protein